MAGVVNKITIVLTSFNRLDYLKRAVASVVAQEYPNMEVLISDDCSMDGSWEWIKEQTENSKVIGIRQLKNFGFPTRPRNDGIFLSTGEIIGFLDDDNEFLPGRLTSMITGFRSGVGAIYCHSQGRQNGQPVPVPWGKQPDYFDPERLERINYIDLSEMMVRREVLMEVGIFDEKLSWNEEWCLWRRIVAGGNTMVCFPQMWNIYTIHRESSRSGIKEIRRGADQRIERKHRNGLRKFGMTVDGLWAGTTLGQFDERGSESHEVLVCRGREERKIMIKTQVNPV